MKVMIIPSWYPRDIGDVHASFFREQARAVRESGCEVSVLSATLAPLRKPLAAVRNHGRTDFVNEDGIGVWRWTGTNIWPGAERLRAAMVARGLAQLYCQHSQRFGAPDVIHIQSMLPAGPGAQWLAQRIGRPYLVTEHSSAYFRGRVSSNGRALARSVAQDAARCFAVSKSFARQLPDWLDMAPDSWAVMPNLIDEMFLTSLLGKTNGAFTFLHVSNLTENKNVDLLIRAFAEGFLGRVDVELHIGGGGQNLPVLQALANRLGVAAQVRFLGQLSRTSVRDAMGSADCFVLASTFETFGVVVIEALAMGCPVIATRCGGPEDIITEGDGLLVPPDNGAALTAAMAQMIASRGHFDPQALRASCAARFGATALGKRWRTVYENVAAGV